jgi:hypothetical protein
MVAMRLSALVVRGQTSARACDQSHQRSDLDIQIRRQKVKLLSCQAAPVRSGRQAMPTGEVQSPPFQASLTVDKKMSNAVRFFGTKFTVR